MIKKLTSTKRDVKYFQMSLVLFLLTYKRFFRKNKIYKIIPDHYLTHVKIFGWLKKLSSASRIEDYIEKRIEKYGNLEQNIVDIILYNKKKYYSNNNDIFMRLSQIPNNYIAYIMTFITENNIEFNKENKKEIETDLVDGISDSETDTDDEDEANEPSWSTIYKKYKKSLYRKKIISNNVKDIINANITENSDDNSNNDSYNNPYNNIYNDSYDDSNNESDDEIDKENNITKVYESQRLESLLEQYKKLSIEKENNISVKN